MAKKQTFQNQLDDFIGWMEQDGMLARWEAERGGKKNGRNIRKLTRKIREEGSILETLEEIRKGA